MKREYMKPSVRAVTIQQSKMLCSSPDGVINPGDKNKPAGARRFNGYDDEDEDYDDDWDE